MLAVLLTFMIALPTIYFGYSDLREKPQLPTFMTVGGFNNATYGGNFSNYTSTLKPFNLSTVSTEVTLIQNGSPNSTLNASTVGFLYYVPIDDQVFIETELCVRGHIYSDLVPSSLALMLTQNGTNDNMLFIAINQTGSNISTGSFLNFQGSGYSNTSRTMSLLTQATHANFFNFSFSITIQTSIHWEIGSVHYMWFTSVLNGLSAKVPATIELAFIMG